MPTPIHVIMEDRDVYDDHSIVSPLCAFTNKETAELYAFIHHGSVETIDLDPALPADTLAQMAALPHHVSLQLSTPALEIQDISGPHLGGCKDSISLFPGHPPFARLLVQAETKIEAIAKGRELTQKTLDAREAKKTELTKEMAERYQQIHKDTLDLLNSGIITNHKP